MRKTVTAIVLAALGLALTAGDASAFGRDDRQARREQRQEARHDRRSGCGQQPAAVAFRPAPATQTAVAGPVTAGSCPGGVCVPAGRR